MVFVTTDKKITDLKKIFLEFSLNRWKYAVSIDLTI